MAGMSPLTLRIYKGSPLTAAEMDGNFTTIEGFVEGLENLFLVSFNPNGTLKAVAVADQSVTAIKLLSGIPGAGVGQVVGAVAGNGLIKAAEGDPISVNLDGVTLEFTADVPPKIRVKTSGANKFTSAATIIQAAGATLVIPHGLSGVPFSVRCTLKCVADDTAGTAYLSTDPEIDISAAHTDNNEPLPVFSFQADATNVTILRNSVSTFRLLKKGVGTSTAVVAVTNFQLKVYASL